MKNQIVQFAVCMLIAVSASMAFAVEATMSGNIKISHSDGLPKSVSVKVTASIVPGEIQEVTWWAYWDCIGGYDPEGDCLENSETYWLPVIKVALESATFDVEIASHQFQIPSEKNYGVITRGCFENEESLKVYGDNPKSVPEKIVMKKDCGIEVKASEFVNIENFLGRPGADGFTKTVLYLDVVPAKSESFVIENGGLNNRRMFATGNERIRIPAHLSWMNLNPVYSKTKGAYLSENGFMTYLEAP